MAAAAPRATDPLLNVVGLSKRYRDVAAVQDASFEVRVGEFLALLGPSGCGKTTTLRLIMGFEAVDGGRIELSGRDITGLPPEQRGIGIVFQDYALFPHLTVLENVMFGLHRAPKPERRERALRMLELVKLAGVGERMPQQLSGGQQQRVALARALAPAPQLVLLDEPFSNLDASLRQDTRQEVRTLLREAGSAVILVTHDQEEALALADRIAVMRAGRLEQIGAPDQVYRQPRSEFVARFLGRANILDGIARGGCAETALGRIPLDAERHGVVRLALRPEQVVLEADPAGSGVVVGREFRGPDLLYWVRAGERQIVALGGASAILEIGTAVRLRVVEAAVAVSAEEPPRA